MNIGIEYDYDGFSLLGLSVGSNDRSGCCSATSANSSRRSRDGRPQHFKRTTQSVRLQGDVIPPKMSYNRILDTAAN